MGGKISIKSRPNSGTNISFLLPSKVIHINQSQKVSVGNINFSHDESTLGTILLADDYPLNRKLFDRLMRSFRLNTKLVENGALAVEEFQANKYSIVFLDIQMPVMDGLDACNKIKNIAEERNSAVWVVALTANTFREDIDRYRSCGFDDFVPKPFNKELIVKAIEKYNKKDSFNAA